MFRIVRRIEIRSSYWLRREIRERRQSNRSRVTLLSGGGDWSRVVGQSPYFPPERFRR